MLELRRYGILFAGVLCAGLVACDDGGPSRGDQAVDEANDRGEAMGEALAEQADDELGSGPPDFTVGALGAVLLTLDDGEIMQAEVEIERGDEQFVLDYARMMVDEHSRHADQVEDLLFVRRLSPIENAVSETLRAEAQAGIEELENAPQPEVDYQYIQLQVMMHTAGEVLVGRLIELAPDDEGLLDFLEMTRDAIARHREQAEGILRSW